MAVDLEMGDMNIVDIVPSQPRIWVEYCSEMMLRRGVRREERCCLWRMRARRRPDLFGYWTRLILLEVLLRD